MNGADNRAFPFAWFTATNTAKATGKADDSISAAVTQQKNLGEIDLKNAFHLSVDPIFKSSNDGDGAPSDGVAVDGSSVTVTSNMEAMTILTSDQASTKNTPNNVGAAAGINFAYVGKDSVTHYEQKQFGNQDYWRYYKITLTIDSTLQVGDVIYSIPTELSGKKVEINLSAGTNSKAVIYDTASIAPANAAAAKPTSAGTAVSASTHKWTNIAADTATTTYYYFGMYVDGESFDTDATVSGDIVVTLTDAA